jgi:hypothetical protein
MVGISYGMGVLIVNLVYLFISLIIGIIVGRIFKKWKIGIATFLIVIILPFYDLIIQKGIKTYYENFVTLEKIYSYPEKDENGKIESLGRYEYTGNQPDSYLYNQKELIRFKNSFSRLNISDFVECYFFESLKFKEKYEYKDFGYARVYFNETPIRYEKLKDETEIQARFQVKTIVSENVFYKKINFEFWDTKKNILLGKALRLNFYRENQDENFRNKYLFWKSGNGIAFSLKGFDTSKKVNNELFFNSGNINIKDK